MNRFYLLLILLIGSGITVKLEAQPRPIGSGPELTPKQIATQKTEMLKKELSLEAKQSKKVYKLYLKQAKKMQEEVSQNSPSFGRPSFGGPPPGESFDRERGDFSPMSGRTERPQMNNRPRPPYPIYQESEEDIQKRRTQMKKILSDEQYLKWIDWEREMQEGERKRRRKEELKALFPELDPEKLETETF